jgi:hypothetical protein
MDGGNVLVQTYKNNQWTTLGKTNLTNTYPYKLAIDGNNTPYVVAGASAGRGVYVIRYNGVKWDTLGTVLAAGKNIQQASITFMSDNTPVVALGELDDALALIYPTVYKYQSSAWASFGSLKAASTDDISITSVSKDVYVFYSQATSGTSNFNDFIFVNKFVPAAQSFIFYALPEKTIGDADFNLTATASSGLPVTYTSSNTAVATISGNKVTIVGAGVTTIKASQTGNSDYQAASYSQTLTVNATSKQDQTINFPPFPVKYYGAEYSVMTATASSGLPLDFSSSNSSVAYVNSQGKLFITGVGTAVITAIQEGNSYYNPATNVSQTITVEKADQTITFDALAEQTISDGSVGLFGTSTSDLPVSYTSSNTAVATVSGYMITIVGVGSTTITASQAGDANYNAAPVVTQTLVVNALPKQDQTITFGTLGDKTAGDANFDLTATASSGLAVTYTSSNIAVATISGNTVTIVGAGSATITASQGGNANYDTAVDVTQTLTVEKADQTITFDALPAKNVADASFDLTATSNSELTITYTSSDPTVATVSGNTVTIVGAGSTTITASQIGNGNYNAATAVTQTLTIESSTTTNTAGALESNAIELFPNPTSGNSKVQFENSFENILITIYTLEGHPIYTKRIGSIINASTDIETTSLTQGVYFVEIKTNQGTLVKRLIKQ